MTRILPSRRRLPFLRSAFRTSAKETLIGCPVEALEPRTLLSISAATLAAPLQAIGNAWVYQGIVNGTTQSKTATRKVVGKTTFNHIPATEIDDISNSNNKVIFRDYAGFDSSTGNYVDYGGVDSLGNTEVYTPPKVVLLATVVSGVTYSENWTETITNNGTTVTDKGTSTAMLTSESTVSVTVGAKTYQAYLVNTTDSFSQVDAMGNPIGTTTTSTGQVWYAPSIGGVKAVTTVNDGSGNTTTNETDLVSFNGNSNYAVLFVGGYNAANNHARYYNAIQSLYTTITSEPYNLDPTHVYFLYADAPDATAPLSDPLLPSDQESGGAIVGSDLSFLQDGTHVLPATSASLQSALSDVSTNIDNTGSFLFWSFDHGNGTSGATANDSADVLNGWGATNTIPVATVAQWLNPIFATAGHATAVLNQCYSGGILDHLTVGPNDFACAAASYQETSSADAFAVGFTRAIQLGLPTGMDDYRFAYATDRFATDGEGGPPPSPPGPALVADVEHPWASGGSFPVLPLNPSTATPVGVTALAGATAGTGPTLSTVGTLPNALPSEPRIIAYDELLADSSWSDAAGLMIDFRIDAVSSGTLSIQTQQKNGGPQTATPVVPGTTVLGYGQELVWTPASGASGATNAFTVEASDGQSLSGTPITVQANVATPAVLLTVSRNGGNASSATATTPTLAFPAAFLQAADVAQTFTLTDAGTQAVILTGLALGGTNPGDFIVTLADGSSLPASLTINPGTSVTIRALFQPQAIGARNATIAFSTNELASPGLARTLALSGEGLSNVRPVLTQIAPISGAPVGQAATIGYDDLVAASDLSDTNPIIDEVVLRIVSVNAGTLTLNGQPVVPGQTDIGLGQSVQWTPPAGTASGPLQAFSVRANDFFQMSATAVPVTVIVGGLNQAQDVINDTTGGNTITLKQIAGNLIQWTLGTQVGTLPISDASGLTINDSGAQDTLVLDNSGGNALPGTLVLNGSFAINGFNPTINTLTKLDIQRSTVSVNYSGASPLVALQAALKNGTITSSKLTAGQAVADLETGSAVTLTLRHLGDADGQNGVDFADLVVVAMTYNRTGLSWATGDFNYDGVVNFADFLILAQNYHQGASPAAANLPAAASDSLDTGVLLKRHRGHA